MGKATEKNELTVLQRKAAELLGSGMRPREVAEKVCVTARTIVNWRKLPRFQQAYDEAERAFVTEMRSRAWDTFSRQLEDEDKRIAQQAASQVLKMAEDMEERAAIVNVRFLSMQKPGEAVDGSDGMA